MRKKEDKFTTEFGEDYIDMVSDLGELGAFDIGEGNQELYSESGDMNAGLCWASCPACLESPQSQECYQCTADCAEAIASDY